MPRSLLRLQSTRWHRLRSAVLGSVALAALAVLVSLLLPSGGHVLVVWPLAGVGFALLCAQGRSAGWALAGGTALAAALAPSDAGAWLPAAVAASVAGPWVAWRAVQVRFTGTSQPFARQTTMVAFLKTQAGLAAPVAATLLTAAALVSHNPASPSGWLWLWVGHWAAMFCGALWLGPSVWELLMARSRGQLPRWREKIAQAMATGWPMLLLVLGLGAAAAALWQGHQPTLARATLLLLLPVLALDALRGVPVAMQFRLVLAGLVTLCAHAWGLQTADLNPAQAQAEQVWVTLAVGLGLAVVNLLLVTAHERRLALKRLERQADTDPLTNLLSLSGLYRQIEELANVATDPGDTVYLDDPPLPRSRAAVLSVQMTNIDSMEQLLGTRATDGVERATSGALTSAAPDVRWSRISKAHFVGLMTEPEADLDALLSRLNFAVVESQSLVDERVGRPQWAVAAVTLDADPLPPVQVIMACLRRVEQTAQDSRQIQTASVDTEAALALRHEAEHAERIRQIIARKQLLLYAQPIVANAHPEAMPHKYEVLVRLQGDQGRVIPPGEFLPVAMRAGLMQTLDMAIMEQTFEWFAAHPRALEALNHCAINLSGPTVASPVIAQRIALGLSQHRLPAHKFTFEITESQAIANPAQATDTIRAIRACGCRVAIDDFGTGVATFDYLKRFDVDYIKIDGAFIKTLLHDPVDRVIVESIVKVAHQMGVRTVAEFVSNPELHAAVTALGVDESQGFVFGEPQPLHIWFNEPA